MLTPDNSIKHVPFGNSIEGKKRPRPLSIESSDGAFEQVLNISKDEPIVTEGEPLLAENPEFEGIRNNISSLLTALKPAPFSPASELEISAIMPQVNSTPSQVSLFAGVPLSPQKLAARLIGQALDTEGPEIDTLLVIPEELLGGIEKLLEGTGVITKGIAPPVSTGSLSKEIASPLATEVAAKEIAPLLATGVVSKEIAPPLATGVVAKEIAPPLATGVVAKEIVPHDVPFLKGSKIGSTSEKTINNNINNSKSTPDQAALVNQENVMVTPNNSNLSNSGLKTDVQLGSHSGQSVLKRGPTAPPPNTRAAFKKMLDTSKDVQGDEENEEKTVASSSIFEMSGKGKAGETKAPQQPQAAGAQTSSLLGANTKGASGSTHEKAKGTLATNQGDSTSALAALSPFTALNMNATSRTAPEPPPLTHAATLQNLIDLIVDKVYTLKVSGQTDTVIVLANPPLLAGASIVISAFDNAKGQFNIAFHDLNQQAQQLIAANQQGLRQGLEEKGYFVHIVVVTTNPIEAPLASSGADPSRSGQEQGREQDPEEQEDQ